MTWRKRKNGQGVSNCLGLEAVPNTPQRKRYQYDWFHCFYFCCIMNGVGISTNKYRVFSAQADWTLTHTNHKDTEQSTIEISVTVHGVTLSDSLIRWSPNKLSLVFDQIPVSADKMPAKWTSYIRIIGKVLCLSMSVSRLLNSLTDFDNILGCEFHTLLLVM
jgi:hypothetical protein